MSPALIVSSKLKLKGRLDMTPVEGGVPQEIIDLILDFTDKKALKACSCVARSFRYTSQKHLFSDIRLKPSSRFWLKSDLFIERFLKILTRSPHLALHVRALTLVEGTGIGSPVWMRTEQFASILVMFANLTKLSIESQLWLNWRSFPPALVTALHGTMALPTLTSVRLRHLRFEQSSELISLLQCSRNLEFLGLSQVYVRGIDNENAGILDSPLGLSSLELDPFLRPLIHSVTGAVDLQRLRFLRTTISSTELEAEAQRLLDSTVHLEHYHVHLSHHQTGTSTITLRDLRLLRTLEITVFFEFATSPDWCNPVAWAARVLSSVPSPSRIQHVILNVHVDERELRYLSRLADLEPVLTAPALAALRRVTVRLDALDVDFSISGGEREVGEALPALCRLGLLEIVLLGLT
ncbi:hypothetical protein GGX14DRAFT_429461 [Mycena pura]|uniref:F-box domain-containing protein n=1 Tax=Mycena pura TaxID=153505 RepID=A0AAD6YJ71_9AGAR|nr:hypothetical protein GGX14DRAFT_429461 [Mycena pura]